MAGAKNAKTAEVAQVIDLYWDGEPRNRSLDQGARGQCQEDGWLPVFWYSKERAARGFLRGDKVRRN